MSIPCILTPAQHILLRTTARIGDSAASVADELRRQLGGMIAYDDGETFRECSRELDDPDAPEPYWIELVRGPDCEVIGVGESETEALADAIASVRRWG